VREELANLKNEATSAILAADSLEELENIRIGYLGRSGKITKLTKELKNIKTEERKGVGILVNQTKSTLEKLLVESLSKYKETARDWFDPTIPGKSVEVGHTHLITQAIEDISKIFEKIGFTRARFPEVDWDWFSFEALNMPKGHPARDEWETFFVDAPENKKHGKMVLTPHTSNGQPRKMLESKLPIRMINIARCHRRQSDISHSPFFYQFEGLVIDEGINMTHLKGTIDYFAKSFFGKNINTRLRPHNFSFTEPSFSYSS